MENIYVQSPDFVQREVAGECLLVPLRRRLDETNSIYVLNDTGAGFWRRVDGKLSVKEIVDRLMDEYDVERERLEKDVAVLVNDLVGIQALAPAAK